MLILCCSYKTTKDCYFLFNYAKCGDAVWPFRDCTAYDIQVTDTKRWRIWQGLLLVDALKSLIQIFCSLLIIHNPCSSHLQICKWIYWRFQCAFEIQQYNYLTNHCAQPNPKPNSNPSNPLINGSGTTYLVVVFSVFPSEQKTKWHQQYQGEDHQYRVISFLRRKDKEILQDFRLFASSNLKSLLTLRNKTTFIFSEKGRTKKHEIYVFVGNTWRGKKYIYTCVNWDIHGKGWVRANCVSFGLI